MQRFVTGLAFVLGFVGVMALGAGSITTPASGRDTRPTERPGAQWIVLPSNPSHTSFGTLQQDGTYRGVVSPDADLTPDSIAAPVGNPSHTSFGTQMPDGTYCGVCVPHTDGADDHP